MDNRKIKFNRLCTMLDCSRNAVMNVESVKRWIDLTGDMGYNSLMLYTEDTYELNNNPYFGYMRGRYSKDELKEIDSYAKDKGMELIPCIQTLAHLNTIRRWPVYEPHFDGWDTLLVGDEFVYQMIDDMFATLSECFTSRIVNIGMDEASIGRGRYFDLHGLVAKKEILLEHIGRVSEIGKKYGFKLAMWSDIFYKILVGGSGEYDTDVVLKEENRVKIPDNVELIFWNYWQRDKGFYEQVLNTHKEFTDKVWFAGGCWCWEGFAPHNYTSLRANAAAIPSCLKCGVNDVILTLWGDNGGECSKYAMLPALFQAAELAKGNDDMDDIKRRFKEKYGIAFDRFMNLELNDSVNGVGGTKGPEKYLLYNDPLMGLMDTMLKGDEGIGYKKCARKLATLKNHPVWGTQFNTMYTLCDALSIKATLGFELREAYKSGDTEKLDSLIADMKKLIKKLNVFYNAFRKQWFSENKGHGFEIQDIRLGGLIKRTENAMERLIAYRKGEIEKIEELEEKLLDINGREGNPKELISSRFWSKYISVNNL